MKKEIIRLAKEVWNESSEFVGQIFTIVFILIVFCAFTIVVGFLTALVS